MNISYNWLKDYVTCDLSANEVAAALTSIGLEVGSVEEIQTIKGGLKGLVVGEVLTCDVHPNSDHMHVCTVRTAPESEPTQIVCGAPNVAAGQKVIVATIGTTLYDGDDSFVIKRSKLRGIESNGMLCGENEIGVGTDTSGIIVLPSETLVGTPAADYYNIQSDYLIEVDITPNRADACSHYGVARDLYAFLLANDIPSTIRKEDIIDLMPDNNDLPINITVENTEACPHYCAITMTDCIVKESPQWLQDKLRTIGVRPINNIVDVTNYVLFSYGQPLHCFDADRIKGGQVHVCTMPQGTPFKKLDGDIQELHTQDLVIANETEPMCIAGVLGGQGSGTYENTRNILLESAYFHPTWVRKSARRHGLNTDASFRFERGIDPNGQRYALALAVKLIKELAGGKISMPLFDSQPKLIPGTPINLSLSYANGLIGKELTKETITQILKSLEIEVTPTPDTNILALIVPPYRVDVTRPCDVVEDILRIYGYNRVELPTALNANLNIKGEEDRNNHLQNIIAEQLIGAGYNEILNNSLTKAAYYTDLNTYPTNACVKLLNPLSQDLSVMRQTLLFGGLESIAYNAKRQRGNLRFFEFGNTYVYDASKTNTENILQPYKETYRLGLWLTGRAITSTWTHQDEESTIYQLKANALNILKRTGLPMGEFVIQESQNNVYDSAITYTDKTGKHLLEIGIIAQSLTKALGIDAPVYYADINWTLLMKKTAKVGVRFKEISKYPAVSRDLALLVDQNVSFAAIEKVVQDTERKLLQKVELFDVYEGKNLAPGKKSYAINCILQDREKTLNDKQIDKIMQNIIANLKKRLDAQLR